MRRMLALLSTTALLLGLSACTESPKKLPLPDGIVLIADQSRLHRKDREIYIRVQNHTKKQITVESFTLASGRIKTVKWSGDEKIGAGTETDLEFDMPQGTCGRGFTASVRLIYHIGDSKPRESMAKAEDRYGNISLSLDRDCAEKTLKEAAKLEVGEPRTVGTGRDSVFELPVTLTPTGKREDVRFAGFGSTVLFNQAPGSPADVDIPLGKADPPAELVMRVTPARCDGHALADDKVGRLFDVKVKGYVVGEGASFYLPLTTPQRTAFFDFYRSYCGLD